MDIIAVPPKIWRPKSTDMFILLPPYPDINDDLYLSLAYELPIHRTKDQPPQTSTGDDVIL